MSGERLTAEEVADLLGIARRSVYHYVKHADGFPAPERVGRTPVWDRPVIEEWRRHHPARRKS